MNVRRKNLVRPWLIGLSVLLGLALTLLALRVFDLSLASPARTIRAPAEQWAMRLLALAAWLAAQAVVVGALPLIWKKRPLHSAMLKAIGVTVFLLVVAFLTLQLAR